MGASSAATRLPVFLTAEWRHLALVNYRIDPGLLQPFVPAGTELDFWQGDCLVSLVAFRFLNTRVCGWQMPFHRDFEEANLRFYVRRRAGDGWRRGVVFLKELVPRRMVAWIARGVYGENYHTATMRHRLDFDAGRPGGLAAAEYAWRYRGRPYRLAMTLAGGPAPIPAGSIEEFITEHYWGYTRLGPDRTSEYEVVHPRWNFWSAAETMVEGDWGVLYGEEFATTLAQRPVSVFLADGSDVEVRRGAHLTA
ncbi:MAG: DUF2071 domain-containing protein [Verrucomicrobiota bacterium]